MMQLSFLSSVVDKGSALSDGLILLNNLELFDIIAAMQHQLGQGFSSHLPNWGLELKKFFLILQLVSIPCYIDGYSQLVNH